MPDTLDGAPLPVPQACPATLEELLVEPPDTPTPNQRA
jgi:hypothetical protein